MHGYIDKITALVFALAIATGVFASEFRRFDPITVEPRAGETTGTEVERLPVPRELIEDGVARIVDAWNGPDFAFYISERAYDRYRLLDAVDGFAPRDAKLRVLSLEDVQTLRQFEQDGSDGPELISEVAVDLVTQVEFDDPVNGFQRRTGTIELVLEVTRPLVSVNEVRE